MASDRSQKERPQDVTLPPISQIFNAIPSVPPSQRSDLSLPPLRVGHSEEHQGRRHPDPRSSRAYDASSSQYSSGAPDLQDPRMKRSRYDQPATSGSSYPPPPISRAASYSTPSSVTTPYQPSGMAMSAPSAVIHRDRTGDRYSGAPSLGYGPSPYSYAPSPAYSSHYAASGSPSRPPDAGNLRGESSRGHDSSQNLMTGQRPHADESQSKANKYECRYCGKGFLRPSALKIHIISHTGDKDFVCPEENCGRRFGVRSNMLRHIRLVHQNNQSQSSGEELSKDDDWSE
ncbi:hypothetical protein DFJ43DRAFT_1135271 [Lentinula guzmanii]|uniref:C2H2-type domain-containing protein n=1 Tax=Lentinula guzmanii TaxID=2804957 RepID=A0AA38N5V4_9AGAR|nr:hypothetical protein DFJ43DRAFT_1135271 [Lentinula guzmanii]